MLDLKIIREHPQEVEEKLQSKDPQVSLAPILEKDEKVRHLKTRVEELKAKRNDLSKQVGWKKSKGEDASSLIKEVEGILEEIGAFDTLLSKLEEELYELLGHLPNLPLPEIKHARDPKDNECIRTVGEKKIFSFPTKNHVELNEKLGLFDFKRAAKISGSGWPLYQGLGARLEWALLCFMIDFHIENGFEFILPPLLARPEILAGSGQLPKFAQQLFHLKDEDFSLYLIPTSEVALNGLHFDEILKSEALPKRYVSYTPCFRREAGAAGSQERGLIRMHQFNKVEMFAFTKPGQSTQMFEQMVESASRILEALGIHHRCMRLVTGDMSFSAAITVDLEVWLPGQNRYYEVSSVSNCTDFQARRSKTRFKEKEGKPEFVHTLNGSGLATSRLMVALLENNQQEDGSVLLPAVLHKYMNGIQKLNPLEHID